MKWQALVLILCQRVGERGGVANLSPACLPISQASKSQITRDLRALLALRVPSPFCLVASTPGRWIEWSPPPRLWCDIYQFDVLLGGLSSRGTPSSIGKGFANPTAPLPHQPLSPRQGPMPHCPHGFLPRVAIGCRHGTSSSSRATIGPGSCIPHPPLFPCSGLAQRRSGSAAWPGRIRLCPSTTPPLPVLPRPPET